jgi:galactitol-specific phosphotransferase system IIC component
MGILTMADNAWDLLVTYIEKIKEGIGIGMKEAMDDEEMTQTKSGSLFSKPETFGAFFKGVIQGSNIEMVSRAIGSAGTDVTAVKEVVKRIVSMIIAAVQALMKKQEEDVEKEVQGQMGDESTGGIDDKTAEDLAKSAEETTDAIGDWTNSWL